MISLTLLKRLILAITSDPISEAKNQINRGLVSSEHCILYVASTSIPTFGPLYPTALLLYVSLDSRSLRYRLRERTFLPGSPRLMRPSITIVPCNLTMRRWIIPSFKGLVCWRRSRGVEASSRQFKFRCQRRIQCWASHLPSSCFYPHISEQRAVHTEYPARQALY